MYIEPDAIEVEYVFYHYNTGWGNNGDVTKRKRFTLESASCALTLFQEISDYAHGRLSEEAQNKLNERLFGGDGVLVRNGRDFPSLKWISRPVTSEEVERHCLNERLKVVDVEPLLKSAL